MNVYPDPLSARLCRTAAELFGLSPDWILPANGSDEETDLSLEGMQRRHISEALDSCGWVIDGDGGAAAILGLPPSSLRSKMKRLGIEKRPFHVVRGT